MTSVTVTPRSVRINNLEIDNEETVKIMNEIEEKDLEQYIVNSINIGASVLRNRMTTEKIDYVEKSDFLVNSLSDKSGNEFTYRMNFNNKKELQDFKRKLDEQKNVEKVNIIYN